MDEKTLRNIGKWENENKLLSGLKVNMTKYQRLKDKKNPDNKEKMGELGDKISDALDENKWMKLDWKEIKRSKGSLEEGIEKVDKKITDRKRKLRQNGVGEMAATGLVEDQTTPDRPTRDWSQEQGEAELDKIYYNWAYGEMQVVKLEDDYMYLMLLDKKGCRHEWAGRNNAIIEMDDGSLEEVKEYSVASIGKSIFPNKEDVKVLDAEKAHRIFR
ncbi:MAG: hypothetical protein LKJ83_08460 [Eubacteriaceae bacterium]|nr:hypothetical protein [Eubacteriaceae bacterium]